ncbi:MULTISPECIES: STAS domain-containing protein [Mycobacterium]|uniref:STAS domain-containing protein n=1 Tax=Mycobacterium kiyosense TaxID=2871094 RepID=A0A9P3Q696_9MYCO|nr:MULTISPECIES: STAS domain-containing protein [Mycobacterium]BDB44818.1 STAS domain-containing protein [Mycobacterium kiyosense]BDE16306.1 STAS domain-containing protein [Mycobacterium sp. 20KCMC460]GLB82782.1 STAS domain-containing protein [Mycobacterium kiyosense]GLB89479.1 STAS domain-containing protein [Mycobacterium kiyosense]GLB94977.1 STAS domain-containing protein [Mycobacterium kiyosense]
MSAVAKSSGSLALQARTEQGVVLLAAEGVLDANNAAALRDSVTKATLDVPTAVVVDVNALQVPDESTWSAAFVSARWQLNSRPDVPIVLVSGNRAARDAITRSGAARFMPVYPTDKGALKAVTRLGRRKLQHAQAKLPANLSSLRESRQLVREWLTNWSKPGLIPVALVVVNVFVENVLEHTGSEPVMRIECDGQTATIAVSDTSTAPALRLASPPKGIDVSGLAIVDALCRAWDSTPTSSGKTVWAIIGPENQL